MSAIGKPELIATNAFVDFISMFEINNHLSVIQHKLNESAVRHAVSSNNIANVNTPGFAAGVVSFDSVLESAETQAATIETSDAPARLDGNNVDIDREMGELTKNSLQHSIYTQVLAARIRQLRSAISGQ